MNRTPLYLCMLALLGSVASTADTFQDQWMSLPLAISNGEGSFRIEDHPIGPFAKWLGESKVEVIDGDFNGDERTDLALIRRKSGWPSWTTLPMAFSDDDEGFRIENKPIEYVPNWVSTDGVEVLSEDFDGDGKTDLALLRRTSGWTTLPMAFSKGDGTFRIENKPAGNITGWAATSGVKVIDGDFDGDGKTDLALLRRTSGWTTLPMAFSNGDGTFRVENKPAGNITGWAATSGVEVIDGDFDGDGKTDLALLRRTSGWTTLPMAFSNGDGTFRVENKPAGNITGWAATDGVLIVAEDFDGDGRMDLALVRQAPGWTTLPMAFSNGDGTFRIENKPAGNITGWAAKSGVEVVPGDFDGDGKADLALFRHDLPGMTGWTTIPMAFSKGDGTFRIENKPAGRFVDWSTMEGVEIITGDFNNDARTDIVLVRPGSLEDSLIPDKER